MLGLKIEDVVVDGRARRTRVQARGGFAVVPAVGQRLLAPDGEFLGEMAEPVDRLLGR